ncbi:MAG: hypothetical protein AB1397_06925 [bacterium]
MRNPKREEMVKILSCPDVKKEYQKRSIYVEPMQGIVKDIFELERCWMRGNENNRWIFASMGVSIQIAQWDAILNHCSPWTIKEKVLNK